MADKTTLIDIYKNALSSMGLTGESDSDGDVLFKHPDLGTFFISLDAENDPEFLRIVFPNFASPKNLTDGNVAEFMKAVNQVNKLNKVVKLYYREDMEYTVSASAECIVAAPNELPDAKLIEKILRRLISTIRAGVQNLVQQAKGV